VGTTNDIPFVLTSPASLYWISNLGHHTRQGRGCCIFRSPYATADPYYAGVALYRFYMGCHLASGTRQQKWPAINHSLRNPTSDRAIELAETGQR
jgi:hypothetical protein